MSSLDNPFSRKSSVDQSEKVAAIKDWARQNLPLTEDMALSVSEFNCSKPTCPNKMTVILVMSEDAPTQKISIHKTVADVSEADVFDGCLELLRDWPS
jgi:hypothetical protein